MPRMCWSVLLGTLLVWSQLAVGSEPLSPAGDCPCQLKGRIEPACGLSPGCCEARRHCFDNAWDGYCAERARWDAVLCKLGTGALCCTPCATRDCRGGAFGVRLGSAPAPCGPQGSAAAIRLPAPPR
jgi:hypothetical protein